jgi:hypothetical protein
MIIGCTRELLSRGIDKPTFTRTRDHKIVENVENAELVAGFRCKVISCKNGRQDCALKLCLCTVHNTKAWGLMATWKGHSIFKSMAPLISKVRS